MFILQLKNVKLNGIYADLAEVIPMEYVLYLYRNYGGMQVTFPKHFYDPAAVHESLCREYNKTNLHELSRKYGYSERWIRQILNNSEKKDQKP